MSLKPQPPGRPQNLLKPSLRVASVLEIDLERLREAGIKGFIFDLDDTLVCAREPQAAPEVCAWIADVRDGFAVYIVSNNASDARVLLAAEHLSLPWLHKALKPSRRFFRRALAEMQLAPHEVAIVGDQLFTDVLGGNRLGAMTILVDPLSSEHKWHRKVMRGLERGMLRDIAYHPPRVIRPSIAPTGQPHDPQA